MYFSLLKSCWLVAGLFFLLTSCGVKTSKSHLLINELENNLQKSNLTIGQNSQHLLYEIEDRIAKPETTEKATYWFRIADSIFNKSQELIAKLETAKKADDINDEYIKDILGKFSDLIKQKEPKLKTQFSEAIGGFIQKTDSAVLLLLYTNKQAVLTCIQNGIISFQNKAIAFSNEQSKILDCMMFSVFEGIVGQNSTVLKKGEKLIITAGIGSYRKAVEPLIKIMQRSIEIGDSGFASYEMEVPDKPGRYTVPVEIKYFNQYLGKEESKIITVEYTVVNSCN